jgi:putative tricarboxylic transport membrane protein
MSDRRGRLGPRLVGLAVCLLGAVTLYDATRVGSGVGYSPVGPAVMPLIVGVGLVVVGLILLARTWIRPDTDLLERAEEAERTTDWVTTLRLGGLLLVYALVLAPLGYVLATAALVPAGAWTLGSRRVIRDVIVGVALAIVVYLGFTQFLGVRLPPGLLDPILP